MPKTTLPMRQIVTGLSLELWGDIITFRARLSSRDYWRAMAARHDIYFIFRAGCAAERTPMGAAYRCLISRHDSPRLIAPGHASRHERKFKSLPRET